ncbi:MAG TPA: ATP-binding protein, partial [Hyalangium sp.]|nr:ATP-binding protein [Hyalangium sp.]
MPNQETKAWAAPFESASDLQEEHQHLLELIDQDIGDDINAATERLSLVRHEARIRAFLERGAATGVYLDEVKDRTACQVLLDYWGVALSRAGRTLPGVRLAHFDERQLPALKDEDSPYVGLESFRSPTYFFGREADVRQLLSHVRDVPLVVVLGASGSGKSSLVMGGILPVLRADTAQPTLRVL